MHEARLDLLELSEQKKSSEIEKNMNCEKKKKLRTNRLYKVLNIPNVWTFIKIHFDKFFISLYLTEFPFQTSTSFTSSPFKILNSFYNPLRHSQLSPHYIPHNITPISAHAATLTRPIPIKVGLRTMSMQHVRGEIKLLQHNNVQN